MGRPPNLKPRPRGTSRRGFFTKSGSAAMALAGMPVLALAAGAGAEEGDDDGTRVGGVGFEHGVASATRCKGPSSCGPG